MRLRAAEQSRRKRSQNSDFDAANGNACEGGNQGLGEAGRGPLIEEGMVFCVEPMVSTGRHGVRMGEDNWAIYSEDGSLAAHFEHTVAVTEAGPRILTPWHLEELKIAA